MQHFGLGRAPLCSGVRVILAMVVHVPLFAYMYSLSPSPNPPSCVRARRENVHACEVREVSEV